MSIAGHSTQDPVSLDPNLFEIRFENELVRVLEARIPPGEGHGMHWHPRHLIFTLSSYSVRDTFPDGNVKEISRKAGELTWGEDLTHATVNVGQTTVHALIIEFKSQFNNQATVK